MEITQPIWRMGYSTNHQIYICLRTTGFWTWRIRPLLCIHAFDLRIILMQLNFELYLSIKEQIQRD